MAYNVLLTSRNTTLFRPLIHEIHARGIPCHVSVFQSVSALIDGNSFDRADAVLLETSLLNAGVLTKILMRGAMGRRTVVFGRAADERTAHILAEAGVQCHPVAENGSALCDMLEAMLGGGQNAARRNAGSLVENLWQSLTAYGADLPAFRFFPEQILHRIMRKVRRMK